MGRLERIFVYPIKALDPVELKEARITTAGTLALDRVHALVEADGSLVNGKRVPAVHGWRAHYEPGARAVRISDGSGSATFELPGDGARLAAWASERLGRTLTFASGAAPGYPDDLEAWGPTIVSTASLDRVRAWFPELSPASIRRRFRANLELGDLAAFEEDRLAGVRFRIGELEIEGSNPCRRCVVPSRDPDGAGELPGFQKRFVERRLAELPAGLDRSRYENPYRLALNTRIHAAEAGKRLRIGDRLR
jgi:hypothetical protein